MKNLIPTKLALVCAAVGALMFTFNNNASALTIGDGQTLGYVFYLGGPIDIPADWNGYGLSGWTLFTAGAPPGSLPDGGATAMLLGAALGALGMVRRFLMS